MSNNISNDEFLKKRAIRQRKIRKRRLKILLVFLIIFLLILGVVLCYTVFFPIEKINFSGSKLYSNGELLEASDIGEGDNLFAVSKSDVEKRLKKKLPFVDKIKFDRKLPGTLNIKVYDAEEFACYFVDDKYFIVSESGWVLKSVSKQPDNVYTVYGAKVKCKVGSNIEYTDQKLKDLTDQFVDAFSETKLTLNSIDVSNILSISLRVEDRFDVKLGTSNFIPEKIKHLAGMVDGIEVNKSGKIDLSMWTNDNSQGTFTPIIIQ